MVDTLTSLTALAVAVFRERANASPESDDPWLLLNAPSDPVLQESQRASSLLMTSRYPMISEVAGNVFGEPDLADLGPREGELDAMVLHPGGGYRASPAALIGGVLASAFLHVYALRLSPDENTYVRTVLEGFEELRRAVRGEQVRAHLLLGFTGVTLGESTQIATPWGIARPAPKAPSDYRRFDPWQRTTTCLLDQALLVPVKFDRAPSPLFAVEPLGLSLERAQTLFPLACALASKETADPSVPLPTWSMLLLPFQNGFSYSQFLVPGRTKSDADLTGEAHRLEEWARILEASHAGSIDTAARRIVSASSRRLDRSDALIDAVMVWENLFGSGTEITFRVTGAIAKALESDPSKRRTLKKALADVYRVRSRVVHGDAVKAEEVNDAATLAIDIAIRILRFCYRRGSDWLALSSSERADFMLLEAP
jgi:hypothetical protein